MRDVRDVHAHAPAAAPRERLHRQRVVEVARRQRVNTADPDAKFRGSGVSTFGRLISGFEIDKFRRPDCVGTVSIRFLLPVMISYSASGFGQSVWAVSLGFLASASGCGKVWKTTLCGQVLPFCTLGRCQCCMCISHAHSEIRHLHLLSDLQPFGAQESSPEISASWLDI